MGWLWIAIRRAKELWDWYSFVVGISTLAITGAGVVIGGTVWLVKAGIPPPLALMAGYCTLVGAVYLTMAPMALRALKQRPQTKDIGKRAAVALNLTAIRLQHQYTILAASKMWVGLDSNRSSTSESSAWLETLVSAIQQGKLKFTPRWEGDSRMELSEQKEPMTSTIVSRDELKRFAASIGQDPEFLRDS